VKDLVTRLKSVQGNIHGCESLTVATTDGFLLASTLDESHAGELLAAVTSVVLQNCASFMDRLKAGRCRSLDFRGNRQVLITFLENIEAYLICVLHPGAKAIDVGAPSLRVISSDLPDVLHGEEPKRSMRFLVQVDRCLVPIRTGFLIGKAPHCDLLVAGQKVDKEHLRFEVLGDKCLVRDLGTKHGSKLNLKQFQGTVELTPGDRISLPRAGGFNILAMNSKGKLVGVKKK
jgi:predicted regulator of Ras-like GTPase activity (Roadblock/LC7/MglB family)